MDEKSSFTKKGFLDYYDDSSFYKDVLKQSEENLELNESIYRKAMKNFNDFIKENPDRSRQSKSTWIDLKIYSIHFVSKKKRH